ncbi:MAG: class I SAM-dependent methyltransferase [Ruminococcus sp.]|uniref:class I SAM-dependent methyltransferase n=1 Tax=Ruminococcus sp. TaxID=41978 RepID=UPI0025F7671E|nr:class I SAM-dependent methyltransferase [Ruminococcus sp.]MBO4867403.1 class I SAM-dependent methyltransferase [Ruminococcus sp.]
MDIDENRIADLEIYLTRMQRSILDKMFFIDKVFEPFKYILDFGCANGELIKAMQPMFPDYSYIGYDISSEMISAAKENVSDAEFFDDWDKIGIPFGESLINISSTIHEVYSYGSDEDVRIFWDRVFGSGFRYVAIRDMSCPASMAETPCDAEKLDIIRNSGYAEWLESFENVWGKVRTKRDLAHFLLKYKYTQNWDREVHENYLPISTEELMGHIPEGYRVVYRDGFTLPYISWQIRKDFGFDFTDNTHIKLILEKI